jgi:hypothetical protein
MILGLKLFFTQIGKEGAFKRLDIGREIKTTHVVEIDLWVKEGLRSK